METDHQSQLAQLFIATTLIEERIKEFADELGLEVTECEWNSGFGVNGAGPHRLDIYVAGDRFTVYFTDAELEIYPERQGGIPTNIRLVDVLTQAYESASLSVRLTCQSRTLPRHNVRLRNETVHSKLSRQRKKQN